MITLKQAQENMNFSKFIDSEITKASTAGSFYCIIRTQRSQLPTFCKLQAEGFDCMACEYDQHHRRIGPDWIDIKIEWAQNYSELSYNPDRQYPSNCWSTLEQV